MRMRFLLAGRPRGVGPHDRIRAILVKIDRRGHFVLASGVVTLCRAVVVHRGSFFASCHDPFNQPWPTTGFTEWANLDANGAAVCFYKIGNALIEVDVPFLFTAHELFFRENCIRRAIDYTTLAMEADIIDADVDWIVRGKRQIGGH